MKHKVKWPKGTKLILQNNTDLPRLNGENNSDLVPFGTIVTVIEDYPPSHDLSHDFVFIKWPDGLRTDGGYVAKRFTELATVEDNRAYYKAITEGVPS